MQELELPSSLTSNERFYVHELCKLNDMVSATRGYLDFDFVYKYLTNFIFVQSKGSKKHVYVVKKNEIQYLANPAVLKLSEFVYSLLKENSKILALTSKEKDELIPKIQKPNSIDFVHI